MRRVFFLLPLLGCALLFATHARANPLILAFSANTAGQLLPCPS